MEQAIKVELSPALKMSYEEKKARAIQKRAVLLGWLASGETWTTLSVTAELLQTTERTALRLLQSLVNEKLLKVDIGIVPHSNLKLYGLTDHALAVVGAPANVKAFNLGRTNPSWVQHHVESQLIRIKAERAGWTDWIPGKLLYVENDKRLKKLPDSLASRPSPDNRKVAIECERYVKSKKRMADVVGQHLQQIVNKHYDFVYYFTPHKTALERALSSVEFVIADGSKVKLNDSHRARFKVFQIENWKGEI